MNLINEKTNLIEKIALGLIPEHFINKSLDPDEEQKVIESYKKENLANKSKSKRTKFEEVSIWVKMFAFVIHNIRTEQIEFNISKEWNPQKNLFEIEDITIYMDDNMNKKDNKKSKSQMKGIKTEFKEIKENNVKKDLNKDINKYHSELIKICEDFSKNKMNFVMLKSSMLKKEKKLRLNKKSRNNISYYFSHLQYYHFKIPKKNALFNIDFIVNCDKHQSNIKYDLACHNCSDNFFYFYKTYIFIYDILVKYFYLPEKLSLPEKEIYIGYYICKVFDDKSNEDQAITNKIIIEYKINQVIREIEALYRTEMIDNNLETLTGIENIATQMEDNEKNKLINGEFSLINSSAKIKMLYKKFVAWNSVFLILLKKYPYFIKEIKDNSLSNSLIKKAKQKKGKLSFFQEYFIKIFVLEEETKDKYMINIAYIKQKLREYVAKTQIGIESFDLSNRSFYEKDDRYMIEDENIYNIEDNIPNEAYNIPKIKTNPEDMNLLIQIWNKFKTKKNNEDQYFIFFGYTK